MKTNSRRGHFDFALWAITRDRPPSTREITDRVDCSYETARRYRNDWINAIAHATPVGAKKGNNAS
jgi:hypothetical protein